MRLLFPLLCALSLTACMSNPSTETRWDHPTKTKANFHADRAECMTMANAGSSVNHSAPAMIPNSHYSAGGFASGFASGMNNGAAIANALNRSTENNRRLSIARSCMIGKGYRKISK